MQISDEYYWHLIGLNQRNKLRNEMHLLEIIELRTVRKKQDDLMKYFSELVENLSNKNEVDEFRIYSRYESETDFSIHIYYESKEPVEDGTQLGLSLIDSLKQFGLINHHQWIEY